MAETHQEVVKVWIEPGCIVCDACESDSPEVFEVQEETCIIRPEALDAEFTKARTPSIIVAAEGCPVDVIKYDLVEVDGPEPWASEEEEAEAAGAAAGGGAAAKPKKAGWEPPAGPPEPQWAGLLGSAHTSGSRSAGGPAVAVRQAKAPAEAVAATLPKDAPPDARAAAMIGVGMARPRPSAADRIRKKSALAKVSSATRRQINIVLAVGWGAIAFTAAAMGGMFQAFLVPRLTKEPDPKLRAGKLSDYPEVGVYNQFKSDGFWIVRYPDGTVVALSTICTHLGCIPNYLKNDEKFKCPCHGSGFSMGGINFEGPAPRPLERHAILLDGENIIVDKSRIFREELGQWTDPLASIQV